MKCPTGKRRGESAKKATGCRHMLQTRLATKYYSNVKKKGEEYPIWEKGRLLCCCTVCVFSIPADPYLRKFLQPPLSIQKRLNEVKNPPTTLT